MTREFDPRVNETVVPQSCSLRHLRTEWGVMYHDGSVRTGFNGRTAETRARAEVERVSRRNWPDNIRLVSRRIYAGEWAE